MTLVEAFRASPGFVASLDVAKKKTRRAETMGDRIELAIRRRGLTLAQVAERADVKASWLSAAKGDRMKNPDWLDLKKVAEVCGETLSYFLEPQFRPFGVVPMDGSDPATSDWKTPFRADGRLDGDTREAFIKTIEAAAKSKAGESSGRPVPEDGDGKEHHATPTRRQA